MVFVLDASGSIGSLNFNKIKGFVKDVVNGYDIGPDKTRIAVVKFSTSVRREFDLDDFTTKEQVLDAVDKITYKVSRGLSITFVIIIDLSTAFIVLHVYQCTNC